MMPRRVHLIRPSFLPASCAVTTWCKKRISPSQYLNLPGGEEPCAKCAAAHAAHEKGKR